MTILLAFAASCLGAFVGSGYAIAWAKRRDQRQLDREFEHVKWNETLKKMKRDKKNGR